MGSDCLTLAVSSDCLLLNVLELIASSGCLALAVSSNCSLLAVELTASSGWSLLAMIITVTASDAILAASSRCLLPTVTNMGMCVCVYSGLTSLSTIFQSYHVGTNMGIGPQS